MAAHYIELAQGDLTALGAGKILYHAPETAAGGTTAIQFSKSVVAKENVVFYSKRYLRLYCKSEVTCNVLFHCQKVENNLILNSIASTADYCEFGNRH